MVDLHYKAHKNDLLPEGLNELMTDISREVSVVPTFLWEILVLRAKPEDIHGFIARYLGALLEARKALTIAGDVCEDIRASCSIEEEKNTNVTEDSVSERKDLTCSKIEEKASEETCSDEGGAGRATDASQHTGDVSEPARTADSSQDRPASSYVEAEAYYKLRQHKDFWSHSVFSLPGSYMNLPLSKPYSVHDTITEASKTRRDHDHSTYFVDTLGDDDSCT